MNLGKLRRRLRVAEQGQPAAVRRLPGDAAEFGIEVARPAPAPVRDEELPPLRVVERPDPTDGPEQG